MEDGIYCAKCDVKMRICILEEYEYEEELPLKDVQAYKCPICKEVIFTKDQAKEMERRTNELHMVAR